MAAVGIFGVALSLFLGFRNNAAYDRWWETRKLWGAMIADLRNLGRHLSIFVREGGDRAEILSLGVAFSHLYRGFLRDVDVSADISDCLDETQSKALIVHANPADAALKAVVERKTLGHLSYRVATRRQFLSLPNMISIRLRRLYRRLSYLTFVLRCFRPGIQARMPLSSNAFQNQSAS